LQVSDHHYELRAKSLSDDNVVLKLLAGIGEIVTKVTGLGALQ